MDTYTWKLNKAIVDRLYYTEMITKTTYGFCTAFTATHMLFIRKGYFAGTMQKRLFPMWLYATAFNATMAFIMLKPLRPEEIKAHWNKRLSMGRWLTSVYHLPLDEHGNIAKEQ